MRRLAPHLLVTLVFAAMVLSAGGIQCIVELSRREPPQALELFARLPTVPRLRAYETRLESESWLARRLRPWMQHLQFVILDYPGGKAVRGREDWFFYRPGLEYVTQRMAPDPRSSDPVAAILGFRDQLAARGIRLLVLPAPNKESIYPEKLTSRARSRPVVVGKTTRSVMDRLRTAGVEVVDLFELYGRAKAGTSPAGDAELYLVQDTHWSPAGAELAAQAVAERIRERDWVGRGSTEYRIRAFDTERIGDLLRMLDVPRIEARLGPERVPCRQVVAAATGEPYQDNPLAEVLVLGDSFSRIYQQDAPGAAGFVAHLARELGQPVASLVNDGGASTLVRQELHRRPALLKNKRVVVWEFVERDIGLGLEGWQAVPLPPATPAMGSYLYY